jgi:hypothetical protein
MAQLTALGVEPGNQDCAAKSFAALKNELAEEKAAREKALSCCRDYRPGS